MMVEIFQVKTGEHRRHVRELFLAYLTDVKQAVDQEFGINIKVEPIVERDMNELHRFSPPKGRLLLVLADGQIVGLGGLRQIGEEIGEIKRMFVRPNCQGKGIGRTVLAALIEEARQIGYGKLRLDVGPYATSAQHLYRSAGFTSIEAYPESEVPSEFHTNWQFMEMSLQPA